MIQNRAIMTGPAFIALGLMDAFFAFWGTALGLLASMNSLGGVCIVWISGKLSDKEGIGFVSWRWYFLLRHCCCCSF